MASASASSLEGRSMAVVFDSTTRGALGKEGSREDFLERRRVERGALSISIIAERKEHGHRLGFRDPRSAREGRTEGGPPRKEERGGRKKWAVLALIPH